MKILQTITTLNKSWGGPSSCTYELVKELNRQLINTDILSIDAQIKDDRIGNDDFIKYVPCDFKTPLFISKSYGKYIKENINKYDVVHANTIWLWTTHQACKYAKKNNKPLIVSTHGMLYPEALKVSAWKKKIITPLFLRHDLRNADVIHATSEQEAEYIRNFGLSNPIAIIPNGLPEIYDSRTVIKDTREDEIYRFGFVGRLNRIKNIHFLLDAWKMLVHKYSNVELIIVGKDDEVYEHELRQFVKMNSLNNVKFLGFLSGENLSNAINSLDCLILPSKSENFGMVVVEALIRQKVVIASIGTPWHDLKTHGCGWWIEPNPAAIACAMEQVVNTPKDILSKMGENGRNLVLNKFTIESVAQQFASVYRWLLREQGKPECVNVI